MVIGPTSTSTSMTATAVSTDTPKLPTDTPGAPTATPTSCPIRFSDGRPAQRSTSGFTAWRARGIVNGYPDRTFRPNNNVTRGQLSKIVSNSAGFNEQPAGQQFQECVALRAWLYVLSVHLQVGNKRLYKWVPVRSATRRSVRPSCQSAYFRPYAEVTRGQTSKIVAIAASLPAPPSAQQTFEDVPSNSTFWEWIESLASAGTIGGYACGGVGEPCILPQNRPYFRPGNNVTRGQVSKVVSNTFFPDCNPRVR